MSPSHSSVAAADAPEESSARWLTPWLAAAAFAGALLSFLVQPLIGKAILPWFGGVVSVWTACLLFFQASLLLGYGGVYFSAKWSRPAWRSYGFLVGLAVALGFLPIVPAESWKPLPGDSPAASVFGLLAATVGVPFVLLSMTAPLVQAWYARVHAGRSPYRLYALSNVGSLLGLLGYPLAVEPNFDVPTQARLWSFGFAVWAFLMAKCAWRVRSLADPPPPAATVPGKKRSPQAADEAVASPIDIAAWLGLAALGSMLLLVVTEHLCRDVASFPLLWIAPLAVYLITYILSFDHARWYRPLPYAAAVAAIVPWQYAEHLPRWETAVAQQLLLLFAGGMLCHGELARRRPPSHDLARYYVLIAAGGALGSMLVGLVAPLVFTRNVERAAVLAGVASLAVVTLLGYAARAVNWRSRTRNVLSVAAVGGVWAGVAWAFQTQINPYDVLVTRDFYGSLTLRGVTDPARPGKFKYLDLRSGTTLHGVEYFDPGSSPVPRSYYGPRSGVGLALLQLNRESRSHRVGIVGLGVGTLAAYGHPGDVYRFYELNPTVAELARRYFTYLNESNATCGVMLGDARLSLAAEPPQEFDLLVLDAFTGDAIPTHLLTIEAFELWLRHLRDGGRLALHVTNRHVDLRPVVAAAAERLKLTGYVVDSPGDEALAYQPAQWIVLARGPAPGDVPSVPQSQTTPLVPRPGFRLWTDRFSSLLPVLK